MTNTNDQNERFENREGFPAEGRSNNTIKVRRGFAAMSPEKQREIARQGGKAAHQQGVAHQWNSQEAREAGRKGGQNSRGGGKTKSGSEDIF